MDIQPSSSREPQPPGSSHESHETAHALPAPSLPPRPEVIYLTGANFRLELQPEKNRPDSIESLTIKALTAEGRTVATYETVSRIPPTIRQAIFSLLQRPRFISESAAFLREVTSLLLNKTSVEFICTLPRSTSITTTRSPSFLPLVPHLEEFAQRPSVADEHFTALVDTETGPELFTVRMYPDLGFMRCLLQSKRAAHRDHEWKIITKFKQGAKESDITSELLYKATDLLTHLSFCGAEGLTDYLDAGHWGVVSMLSNPVEASLKDEKLACGAVGHPTRSMRDEKSSTTVSLEIGKRLAVISITPFSPNQFGSKHLIIYCPDDSPELTGFQLQYIQTVYNLITSPTAGFRDRGCEMLRPMAEYAEQAALAPDITGIAPEKVAASESALRMFILEPPIDLLGSLGHLSALRIASIPGIIMTGRVSDSIEAIRVLLEGGREIFVKRNPSTTPHSALHWFDRMRCVVFSDGSIHVNLSNQLNGSHRAVINSSRFANTSSQSEVLEQLIETFALSTGRAWTEIVGLVEKLSGQSEIDPELRTFDLSHTNIPPYEDRSGALMIEAGAKCLSFICAGSRSYTPLTHSLLYLGSGAVAARVSGSEYEPTLELVLKDGHLSQISIFGVAKHAHVRERFVRFSSASLKVGSSAFDEVLDAAEVFAKAALQGCTKFFGDPRSLEALENFKRVLSTHMLIR